MKNEIFKQIKQLIIVIISGVCSYFIPIAHFFVNIPETKILTGFDIAIFSFIGNILFSAIDYFYKKNKLMIRISIEAIEQESDKLILYEKDIDKQWEVKANIKIEGKKRKCPLISLKVPDCYLLQVQNNKSSSFVKEISTSEEYEIDLNEILQKSPKDGISITREIKFILLLEEHNKGNNDYLICEKESGWKYLGLTNIESKRLQLLQK